MEHPLAVVVLGESFPAAMQQTGKSHCSLCRGADHAGTDPLRALASLGESTALGKWKEKNSNFSYVFDKICPVGFGQGSWVCQVVQGAFASGPWALQRENDASKANLEN